MQINTRIPIEHDFLKEAKINPQGENSVFYNSTNQFQQYYDNDEDNDNDNDNVDNDDDNDNKQNKSKIAAPKNIKLPPTFRATRQVDRVGQHFERGEEGNRRHTKGFLLNKGQLGSEISIKGGVVEFSAGFQVQNANGLFAGVEDSEYIAHK